MDAKDFGETALTGWRAKVADPVAGAVSQRTSADADQVRAAVGILFFCLSLFYVASTLKRAAAG